MALPKTLYAKEILAGLDDQRKSLYKRKELALAGFQAELEAIERAWELAAYWEKMERLAVERDLAAAVTTTSSADA